METNEIIEEKISSKGKIKLGIFILGLFLIIWILTITFIQFSSVDHLKTVAGGIP